MFLKLIEELQNAHKAVSEANQQQRHKTLPAIPEANLENLHLYNEHKNQHSLYQHPQCSNVSLPRQ